jgi:hypothetical protein
MLHEQRFRSTAGTNSYRLSVDVFVASGHIVVSFDLIIFLT